MTESSGSARPLATGVSSRLSVAFKTMETLNRLTDETYSWQFDPMWSHVAFRREFRNFFFAAMLCR